MSCSPVVSVIIPTYNRAKVLTRAIDSALSQTFCQFELIVVNDGSTDETGTVLKQYGANIRVLTTENRGVSAARNLAVLESKGEYLAFLDSDDEWMPKKLECQMDFMSSHPKLRLVHSNEIWIRNGVRVNQKNIHRKEGGDLFARSLRLCLISPSAVLLEKSLFNECGGFREDFPVCEDYDLWLKITARHQIGFIDEPLIVKHGGHDDQLSRKYVAMDLWRLRSMISLLEKIGHQTLKCDLLRKEIQYKSEILLKGCEKHDNCERWEEVYSLVKNTVPA